MIKECPLCPKPTQNQRDNMFTCGIQPDSGLQNCFRCHNKGNWYQFKSNLSQIDYDQQFEGNTKSDEDIYHREYQNSDHKEGKQTKTDSFIELQNKMKIWSDNLHLDEFKSSLDQLTNERKLTLETLRTFGIGLDKVKQNVNDEYLSVDSIVFPQHFAHKKDSKTLFSSNRVKFRGIGSEQKSYSQIFPSGVTNSVFGLNTLDPSVSKQYNNMNCVCITEGEYDAMSVWQELKIPSISLPQGSSSLPIYLIKYLENYERIYLWMDFDESGSANIDHFVRKLGSKRTQQVFRNHHQESIKDANDALKLMHSEQKDTSSSPKPLKLIDMYIKHAKTQLDLKIVDLKSRKDEVQDLFANHKELMGVQSSDFKWFNRTLKGLRKGEMTIWTGSTGTGKTTLLSQYALDFSKNKVNTLFCSFEIKYNKIIQKMLLQHSRSSVKKIMNKDQFDLLYKDLENKSQMQFTTFQGGTSINLVSEIIDYAVQAYDINHVIVDNLQFMLSDSGTSVFSKLDMQDETISKLRRLATEKDIHLSLVIHPRKNDGPDLSIHSVFGTAKSIQEADNIVIIQSKPKYRYIDVRKNRYDGTTGRAALGFNGESHRFFELTNQEVRYLDLDEGVMKEVIKKRQVEMQEIKVSEDKKDGDGDGLGSGATKAIPAQDAYELKIDREINYMKKIEEMINFEENSGPFFKNDLHNVSNYQKYVKPDKQDDSQQNTQNQNLSSDNVSRIQSDHEKNKVSQYDNLNQANKGNDIDKSVSVDNASDSKLDIKNKIVVESDQKEQDNYDIAQDQFGEDQTNKDQPDFTGKNTGGYFEVNDQMKDIILGKSDLEIDFDKMKHNQENEKNEKNDK